MLNNAENARPASRKGWDFLMLGDTRVYIATGLANHKLASDVMDVIVAAGSDITFDWTRYCPGGPREGLISPAVVAQRELRGVKHADLLIAILPGGEGTHCEIGMALALGIPVLLLTTLPDPPRRVSFYELVEGPHPLPDIETEAGVFALFELIWNTVSSAKDKE